MLRAATFLIALFILSACSSSGPRKDYRPASPLEMSAAAASISGVDINNTARPDPDNPNPRIDLLPTPGQGQWLEKKAIEVLRSDPDSGAYVALAFQVPPTKYFQVLGDAGCHDWIFVQLITKDLLLSNPDKYGSGSFSGDKPVYQCVNLMHRKFKKRLDPTLENADGVILDPSSVQVTERGWITQRLKIKLDGWAIRFKDPTFAEIEERLKKPARTKIDELQLKAIAYWIEKNKISDHSELIKEILPFKDDEQVVTEWNRGANFALLKALAATEDSSASDLPYRKIMLGGIRRMLLPGSLSTVPFPGSGAAPIPAANVIACRNQPGGKEVLRKVVLEATGSVHKRAAIKALVLMGDTEFLKTSMRNHLLGDMHTYTTNLLSMPHIDPMKCPYRSM